MSRKPYATSMAVQIAIAHAIWCGFQMGAGQEYNEEITKEQLWPNMDGLKAWLENPNITPEEHHRNWVNYKLDRGWTLGPVKSDWKKTHPSLVPFDELPEVEQNKDIMDLYARRVGANIGALVVDIDRYEEALRDITTANPRMAVEIARKALRMAPSVDDAGMRYVYTYHSMMRHLPRFDGFTLCGYREVPRDEIRRKSLKPRLCKRCAGIHAHRTEP